MWLMRLITIGLIIVDLWKRLLEAKKSHEVQFIWVKGHAGHEYNERCDSLAVKAYNNDNLAEL